MELAGLSKFSILIMVLMLPGFQQWRKARQFQFSRGQLKLLNKNSKAFLLFTAGIESLLKLLPYYDFKSWSNYFLYEYPKKYYSSYTYHILVTEQLKALYI